MSIIIKYTIGGKARGDPPTSERSNQLGAAIDAHASIRILLLVRVTT